MNFNKLKESVGKRLKLRPPPRRWEGNTSVEMDDFWKFVEIVDNNTATLRNVRTKQVLQLAPDHIHSFTSNRPSDLSFDGFLELKVTVDLTSAEPSIDIIRSGAARTLVDETGLQLHSAFDAT